MEYNLERKIQLCEETEYSSLYNWYLQEFSNNEEIYTKKFTTWDWGADFEASEVKYCTHIQAKSYSEESQSSAQDTIQIKLEVSGNKNLAVKSPPKFSMFGTNREIQEFYLTIKKLDSDDEKENCKALGIPSYTSEIDFSHFTTEDSLYFTLYLLPKNFDKLQRLIINSNENDKILFCVKKCSGFYAEWTPAISTNYIKILTNGNEQTIITKNENIKPPKLGDVQEFDIYLSRTHKLALQEDDSKGIEKPELMDKPYPSNRNVDHFEAHFRKLLLPMWLIVGLLLLILIF